MPVCCRVHVAMSLDKCEEGLFILPDVTPVIGRVYARQDCLSVLMSPRFVFGFMRSRIVYAAWCHPVVDRIHVAMSYHNCEGRLFILPDVTPFIGRVHVVLSLVLSFSVLCLVKCYLSIYFFTNMFAVSIRPMSFECSFDIFRFDSKGEKINENSIICHQKYKIEIVAI